LLGSAFVNNQASDYFGNSSGTILRSYHRFADVSIPAGAVIQSAILQFKASASRSGTTCNAIINFQAADDPAAPATAGDVTGASLTSDVTWAGVGAWTSGIWYDSPDLTNSLQEVIDRVGWSENNAIIAHVRDNSSSSSAYRQCYSRGAGAEEGVKLVVTYTT
jgi:type IV pilus assembly protein PilY1